MSKLIIGFSGKMGSGKSTACQMIKDVGHSIDHINMKDGLVAEIKNNFPDLLAELQIENVSIKPTPPTLRALLRNYGTEVRRKDDPDYWVNIWKKSVEQSTADIIVCDDVRFLNEARAVKEAGGIIIRLNRTDITNTGTHQSETEMEKIKPDIVITTGPGEQEKLETELKNVVCKYM